MQAKLPTHLLGTFSANRDRALHAALARTHGPPLAADTRGLRFTTTQRTLKHRQHHGLQYEQDNLTLNTVCLEVPLLPLHPTFLPRLLHWLEHWLGLRLVRGDTTVPPTASTQLDEIAQLREAVLFMETLPGPLIEKAFRAMMGKNQGRTFTPLLQAAFAYAADPSQPRLWERIHAGMRDQAEQQRRLAEEAAGAAPPLHQLQPAAAADAEVLAVAAAEEEDGEESAAEEEGDEAAAAEDGVAAAPDVWQVQAGDEWMEGAASDDDLTGPASFQGLGGAATLEHVERASSLDLSHASPPNFPRVLAAAPALPHRAGLPCGGPYGATPRAVLTAEQDRLYRQLRREALEAALKAHEARLEAEGADFLSARLLAVHSVQCVRSELEARALQAAMSGEGGGAASWATDCAAATASTGAGLLSAPFPAFHTPFGGALGGRGWVPQPPTLQQPEQQGPGPLGGIRRGDGGDPSRCLPSSLHCWVKPPSTNLPPRSAANQRSKRSVDDQPGGDDEDCGGGGEVRRRRRRRLQGADSPSALGPAGGAGSAAVEPPWQALLAAGLPPPLAPAPQLSPHAPELAGRLSPLLLEGDAFAVLDSTALAVLDSTLAGLEGPPGPAAAATPGLFDLSNNLGRPSPFNVLSPQQDDLFPSSTPSPTASQLSQDTLERLLSDPDEPLFDASGLL